MARLYLSLLGGFLARLEPGGPLALPTKKTQALLAYLALPVGHAHQRDKLATLLWGGTPDVLARNSFRQALFILRKALASTDDLLRIEGDTVALDCAGIEVDAIAFERAVVSGTPAALEKVATLYQGDLLAGLAVDEAPFEEWLLAERERFRELALEGLAKLLVYQRSAGSLEEAIRTALRIAALDPLQESVHRTLMRLFVRSGRRGAALRQYQQCVSALQRELGAEPEAETKALYREILRARAAREQQDEVASGHPIDRELSVGSEEAVDRRRTSGARDVVDAEQRLVGRDAELALLFSALADVMASRGHVIAVLGEAGIGKTEVAVKLADETSRRGVPLLIGRGYETEQTLPFGPWADAFRAARLIEDLALLQKLGPAHRAQLARFLPEVHAGHRPANRESDHRPLFESVLEFIKALAARQPLVIILEDVHWADDMTVRLAAFVGHRLSAWPVMLILTVREEELSEAPLVGQTLDELAREAHFTRLVLAPLTKADTETLVKTLHQTRTGRGMDVLTEQVWKISEGNPFVIVEALRAIGTAPNGATLALPQRVHDIVERRLGRFSESSRQVVATAAVIGRDFEFALLQRASGLNAIEAAGCVEELVRRRVLHGVDDRLDFVHERIREAAHAGLGPHRQTMLHRSIADAIEALYADTLEAHDVALGTHYRKAGVWERAMMYSGRAGVRALSAGAYLEASTLLQHALDALDHLALTRELAQLRADLLLELANTRYPAGDIKGMLQILRSVETIVASIGEPQRLRRCLEGIAYCLRSLGDVPAALQTIERAVACRVTTDQVTRFGFLAARPYYRIGEYRRATEAARAEIDMLRGEHLYSRSSGLLSSLRARLWLILSLAELGEFPEAQRVAEEMFQLADARQDPTDILFACVGAGRMHLVRGDFAEVITRLEPVLPLRQNSGDLAILQSRIGTSLGLAYVQSGRTNEGLRLLQDGVSLGASLRFIYGQSLALASLAEGYLLAGRIYDAERSTAQALEFARHHGHRGWEAWTLRLHGDVARHRGEPGSAANFYREAMSLAQEREMRPLLAHCHRGLAGLASRERAWANHHLTIATTMYHEMDMSYWLEQAKAEMNALT